MAEGKPPTPFIDCSIEELYKIVIEENFHILMWKGTLKNYPELRADTVDRATSIHVWNIRYIIGQGL